MQAFILLCFGLLAGWFGSWAFTNYQLLGKFTGSPAAKIKDLEGQVTQKDSRIRKLDDEVEEVTESTDALRDEVRSMKLEKDASKGEAESLKRQLEKLDKDFETYREDYRLSLKGKRIKNFSTGLVQFDDVEIVEIEPDHILVQHSAGRGRYPLSELSPEIQNFIAYRPNIVDGVIVPTGTKNRFASAIKRLVKIQGGGLSPYISTADPDYYVVYHSASY